MPTNLLSTASVASRPCFGAVGSQKLGTYGDAKPFQGTLQCRLAPRTLGEIREGRAGEAMNPLPLPVAKRPRVFTRPAARHAVALPGPCFLNGDLQRDLVKHSLWYSNSTFARARCVGHAD